MKKGDRVALYMPASPLLAASMLACARIGAIHRSVCTVYSTHMMLLLVYMHCATFGGTLCIECQNPHVKDL